MKIIEIDLKCLGEHTSPQYASAQDVKNRLKSVYDRISLSVCDSEGRNLVLWLWIEDDVIDLLHLSEESMELIHQPTWVQQGVLDDGALVYRAERQGGSEVVIELIVSPHLTADYEIKHNWKLNLNSFELLWRRIAAALVKAEEGLTI
jgi:hypothetical protein